MCFLWYFFVLFHQKNVFYIIFICFFDEVSNFRKRILTSQKPAFVIKNYHWNCMKPTIFDKLFESTEGTLEKVDNFCVIFHHFSSVIRQKGEYQNGCFKEIKHAKFPEKRRFFAPLCAHVRKKLSFFGKFGELCFLETPVLRFAPLPYYRCFTKVLFQEGWVGTRLCLHQIFKFWLESLSNIF